MFVLFALMVEALFSVIVGEWVLFFFTFLWFAVCFGDVGLIQNYSFFFLKKKKTKIYGIFALYLPSSFYLGNFVLITLEFVD